MSKLLVAAVNAVQREGRHDVASATELADRLGGDRAQGGKDKHLGLRWAAEEFRAASAPSFARGRGLTGRSGHVPGGMSRR